MSEETGMTLQQNTDRIRTTHIGSLPRPHAVLDLMKAKYNHQPFDQSALDAEIAKGVRESVRKQAECGIDIITDGEISKPGFYTYVQERLEGFEARAGLKLMVFEKEVAAFPEYYEQYFKGAMLGGAIVSLAPVVCVGPIKYRGQKAVQADIDNLRAAAKAAGVAQDRLFLPVTSPNGVGINEYYKTEEEYLFALADALNKECRAIIDAGLLLQLDDPFITDVFVMPRLDRPQMERRAALHVEVNNAALKGIAWEKVRFHTCYGINQGPRIHEASLADVIQHVLRINAGSYSFEAANPRHEHEYHVFENTKVPDGKVICPGVVTHASNIVEHPQLIAEWLVRFAKLVGRDNVMAGADCGFSSQALYRTEVHETVIWEKFKAMREGAAIASRQLWR
jgi:5-methyltetrahydropteroyltriglutamate--homocysteine methyltransferase